MFGETDKANISKDFDHRTAAYKYDVLKGKELENDFEMHPLDENDKQKSWVPKYQPLQYVRFSRNERSHNKSFPGRIVLVGQASNYNVSTSRKGEYVFKGKKSEVLNNNHKCLEVPYEKMEDFKFINRDGEGESHELKDWAFWKNSLDQGIPVFYREREVKGEMGIVDFGLSFTYKQPANYTVKDLLPNYSKDRDLAEIIFGSAEKNNGFKGRVFLGNAFCVDENPRVEDKVIVTLGSPNPVLPHFI